MINAYTNGCLCGQPSGEYTAATEEVPEILTEVPAKQLYYHHTKVEGEEVVDPVFPRTHAKVVLTNSLPTWDEKAQRWREDDFPTAITVQERLNELTKQVERLIKGTGLHAARLTDDLNVDSGVIALSARCGSRLNERVTQVETKADEAQELIDEAYKKLEEMEAFEDRLEELEGKVRAIEEDEVLHHEQIEACLTFINRDYRFSWSSYDLADPNPVIEDTVDIEKLKNNLGYVMSALHPNIRIDGNIYQGITNVKVTRREVVLDNNRGTIPAAVQYEGILPNIKINEDNSFSSIIECEHIEPAKELVQQDYWKVNDTITYDIELIVNTQRLNFVKTLKIVE